MIELKLDVYKKLSKYPKRLLHVLEVSNIASSIAMSYKVNVSDAKIAGLIHDYSKYENIEFYNKYISKTLIKKYEEDTYMYHAISASNYFKKHYKINNDIYSAVYYHVTGRNLMSRLEKILFISDSIYLNGNKNSRYLYELALKDLNIALLETIRFNDKVLKEKGLSLSFYQTKTYEFYKELK